VEDARALTYRLFTVAERNRLAQEANAYNSLVVAWPEVQSKAAELRSKRQNAKQVTLFDSVNKNKGKVK
jgi:putative DNA methylase